MLDFVDQETSGEPINPILSLAIKKLAGDMKNPLALHYNVNFARVVGTWIRPGFEQRDLLISLLIRIPTVFNLLFMVVNLCLNITKFSAVIENLSYTSIGCTSLYMSIFAIKNAKENNKIVEELRKLNEKFNIGIKSFITEKKVRLVSMGFCQYVIGGCGIYAFIPYFTVSECSHSGAVVCGLPTAGSFPYDATKHPAYELTYLFQIYGAYLDVLAISFSFLFVCCAVLHLVAHLEYLIEKIQEICKAPYHMREKLLREFTIHHAALLDLGDQISEICKPVMLAISGAMPLVISVLLFQITLMTVANVNSILDLNAIRYFLNMCGWIGILLAMSYIGQYLMDKSTDVANHMYEIPWYEQSVNFQKHIWFVILRAQKPMALKTSMSFICLTTFMNVMSSTYSYFTLLYNFLAN